MNGLKKIAFDWTNNMKTMKDRVMMTEKLTLEGKDNSGKPRQLYADRIAVMDDDDFTKQCEQVIWLSAYASNNPRSDYHWWADACYNEAQRRGKPELYTQGYNAALKSVRG